MEEVVYGRVLFDGHRFLGRRNGSQEEEGDGERRVDLKFDSNQQSLEFDEEEGRKEEEEFAYVSFSSDTGEILGCGTRKKQGEGEQRGKQDLDGEEVFLICPGFIDIHNHGLGGCESVLEYWLHDHSLSLLPKYGTTTVLASVTLPKALHETTVKVLETLEKKITTARPSEGCCRLGGIHLEGPIIQTCGGLPDSHKDISDEDFNSFLDTVPSLKIMTISPTLEKARNFSRLRILLERGVRAAIGHDLQADEASILGCLHLAAEFASPSLFSSRLHMTHMFNVSSFHHRSPTLCNFGLLPSHCLPRNLEGYASVVPLESPTIEVIGDLVHVHPLALRLAIETRGDEMAIITDAIMDVSSLGTSNYAGNEIEVQVIQPHSPSASSSSSSSSSSSLPRGKVVIKGTNTIAGSCTNLLRIFNDLIQILGISVEKALKMLTLNPARIAKIEEKVGTLEKGKKADFLLFDRRLNLVGVYIDGRRIKLTE